MCVYRFHMVKIDVPVGVGTPHSDTQIPIAVAFHKLLPLVVRVLNQKMTVL